MTTFSDAARLETSPEIIYSSNDGVLNTINEALSVIPLHQSEVDSRLQQAHQERSEREAEAQQRFDSEMNEAAQAYASEEAECSQDSAELQSFKSELDKLQNNYGIVFHYRNTKQSELEVFEQNRIELVRQISSKDGAARSMFDERGKKDRERFTLGARQQFLEANFDIRIQNPSPTISEEHGLFYGQMGIEMTADQQRGRRVVQKPFDDDKNKEFIRLTGQINGLSAMIGQDDIKIADILAAKRVLEEELKTVVQALQITAHVIQTSTDELQSIEERVQEILRLLTNDPVDQINSESSLDQDPSHQGDDINTSTSFEQNAANPFPERMADPEHDVTVPRTIDAGEATLASNGVRRLFGSRRGKKS